MLKVKCERVWLSALEPQMTWHPSSARAISDIRRDFLRVLSTIPMSRFLSSLLAEQQCLPTAQCNNSSD